MADEIVAPVKNILKACELGLRLAKRSKSVSGISATQVLEISESAQSLQRSIERITEAYQLCRAECGESFGEALQNDDELKQRFKNLRSDVRDRIDDCEYDEDDPESLQAAAFDSVNREAQNCADQCVAIFYNVREQIGLAKSYPTSNTSSSPRDDRTFLTSMRQRAPSMNLPLPSNNDSPPTPAASPYENQLCLEISPAEPVKPKSPWAIEGLSQFDIGARMSPPAKSPRETSRDLSPGTATDAQGRLIPTHVVQSRVRANDEFLARRRDSRLMFEKQLRHSVSSIDGHRVSGTYATSPALSSISATGGIPTSPLDGRTSRSSDYQMLMTRQRSQGAASQGTRSSVASSNFQDRSNVKRRDSEDDSIFGLRAGPLSPALSEHRSSGNLEAIAATLRLPDFGEGVEPGLEVLDQIDYSAGLIPVEDNFNGDVGGGPASSASSPVSVVPTHNPMRHDASFFRFGGFCDGARALLRGETGFKIYKRPAGIYDVMTSTRCTKCSYEVNWNDAEKDRLLDRGGIYMNSGIRFRQRFLSKSHLKSKSIDDSYYACLFCVEAHKTVESNDATVFFSVLQLFRHLATHTRPVPDVTGIIVMYGSVPSEAVDFDLHFPTMEPISYILNSKEIAPKIVMRPTATAIVTHHPKSSHSGYVDPSGHLAMHFAIGAKILGISFPQQFAGTWCMGYHNGIRGAFPASTITLDLPARGDLLMNQSSSLVATARWDFKPKDAKDSTRGWLKFSKGDTITNIGYTFQDQWCWSGCTNKGKNWGVFPQAFVENLHEGGPLTSSPSVKHRFGLKGRMPLSKSPTSSTPLQHRQPSIRSTSSNGSNNNIHQAGLEVVQSPVQNASSSSGWRR